MRMRALFVTGCVLAAALSPAVSAQAHQSQNAIAKAKATKLAKAGVLKKSDLPKFAVTPVPVDPTDAEDEASLFACLGARKPTFVVRNHGLAFTKGSLEIDSAADVVDSVKHAKSDLKAFSSKKAPGCYKQLLTTIVEREDASIQKLSVKRVTIAVTGADAVSAYKYDVTAGASGVTFQVVGYVIEVLVGQTEFSLGPARDNRVPDLAQSVALASLLAKRIRDVR